MEAARITKLVVVPLALLCLALPWLAVARMGHGSQAVADRAGGDDDVTTESSATYELSGETALTQAVKQGIVEIDNGRIDCQVAACGPGRVSWEVVPKPGVDASQMEVRVKEEDGVLRVKDKWHGGKLARRPEVRVTLWLPADSALELALGNGNVSTALNGALNVAVGNGNVQLDGAPVTLAAELGNGSLRGSCKPSSGDSSVSIGNGNIELRLLPGSDAQIDATTAVGRVEAEGLEGQVSRANWSGSSYSGQIGTGKTALQLEIGNGSVRLNGNSA